MCGRLFFFLSSGLSGDEVPQVFPGKRALLFPEWKLRTPFPVTPEVFPG